MVLCCFSFFVYSVLLTFNLCRENTNRMINEADVEILGSRYWGQNSHGASNGDDIPNYQKTISYYCQVSRFSAHRLRKRRAPF